MGVHSLIVSKQQPLDPIAKIIRGDRETYMIRFRLPRHCDGVDLSSLGWAVKVRNAAEIDDIYQVTPVLNGGNIEINWTLPQMVSEEIGITVFELEGVGTEDQVWQSAQYSIEVEGDLDAQPAYEPEELSTVQKLIADVGVRVTNMASSIDSFEERISVAEETINTSVDKVEEAIVNIETETARVNEVIEKVNAAAETANEAVSNANASVDTANTVLDEARVILETANDTLANSSMALNGANEAISSANASLENSSTAIVNANSALENANRSLENSETAIVNANTAVVNSETAIANANTAIEQANVSSTRAESSAEKADAAKERADQATQNVNTIVGDLESKLASGYFNGKDGQDGKDGNDGYTPIKNIDYFDGKDGRDGVDGKDASVEVLEGTTVELATMDDIENIVVHLNEKQPIIDDIEDIRAGAALGATALQEIPDENKFELIETVILNGSTIERTMDTHGVPYSFTDVIIIITVNNPSTDMSNSSTTYMYDSTGKSVYNYYLAKNSSTSKVSAKHMALNIKGMYRMFANGFASSANNASYVAVNGYDCIEAVNTIAMCRFGSNIKGVAEIWGVRA